MTTVTPLTTRTLTYVDADGDTKEVSMTLLKRVEDDGSWRIGLRLGPPINWEHYTRWDDVLHAITSILWMWWARLIIGRMPLAGNLRWRDDFDCGLVARRARPTSWVPPEIPPPEENPGDIEVLSTSTVAYTDETGGERELPLTIFTPRQGDDGRWKCGFTFGPKESAPIYYGVGDDFIEAFLDAAAMVRVIYESKVPQGWKSTEDKGCEYLPYKLGRSFCLDEHTE